MIEARKMAVLQLAFAALLWSTAGVVMKGVPWTPFAIHAARSGIAAIVIVCFVGLPRSRPTGIGLLAAIFYALSSTCFAVANKYTTAANAVVLSYTCPVYVALLSGPLLGEKIVRRDWILIFLTLAGVVLFFADELTTQGFIGNIVALANGVLFAVFILLLRKQKDATPAHSVFWGNLLAAVCFCPTLVDVPWSNGIFWSVLFLGVFQLGFSYVLYTWAIKRTTALEASIIPMIEPIAAPIWVALVYGEFPGPWALVGAAIVLLGVFWRSLGEFQNGANEQIVR